MLTDSGTSGSRLVLDRQSVGDATQPQSEVAHLPWFGAPLTHALSAGMPLPLGSVPPCLPNKAPQPPSGDAWLHEIKHDGFRIIAREDGNRVRLYSRPGNDVTWR